MDVTVDRTELFLEAGNTVFVYVACVADVMVSYHIDDAIGPSW